MGDVIRRYPLISYFVIAYAGSWAVWALFVLSLEGSGLLPFHAPSSFLVLIGIGTFTGPTVSALVVTAATAGRAGIVRLLWRIVQWRVGLAWYLFGRRSKRSARLRSRAPWRRSRRLICCRN